MYDYSLSRGAKQAFIDMAAHPFFSNSTEMNCDQNVVALINEGNDSDRFREILMAALPSEKKKLAGMDCALDAFIEDMRRSTPGTFGTWAYDTTYIGSEASPEAKEKLTEYSKNLARGVNDDIMRDAYEMLFEDEDYPRPSWLGGPNPRFIFLFGNWGDSLDAHYQSGDINAGVYADFSGPLFGSEKPNSTWTPKESHTRAIWRDDKEHNTRKGDYIGRFASAIYGTPLWGAFMTDYIKGIHTPDETTLGKAFRDTDRNTLYNAMNQLLSWEIGRLRSALSLDGFQGDGAEPILLLTREAYNQVKKASGKDKKPLSKINSWQVIRWPHHSGSGSGYFKPITLAYAYGRLERALEYIEDSAHEWQWPFRAYVDDFAINIVGDETSCTPKLMGAESLPSLCEWLTEGYSDKGGFWKTKAFLELMDHMPRGDSSKFKSKWVEEDLVRNLFDGTNEKRCLSKESFKDGMRKFLRVDDNELDDSIDRLWNALKPAGNAVEKELSAKSVEEALTSNTESFDLQQSSQNVDAAFLLGWRNESALLKEAGKSTECSWEFLGTKDKDFDETLMPKWKNLGEIVREIQKAK